MSFLSVSYDSHALNCRDYMKKVLLPAAFKAILRGDIFHENAFGFGEKQGILY